MDTIEAFKAKQAEQLEKAIKHETMRLAVRDALGLTDANFSAGYMHTWPGDCHVNLTAADLTEALVIAERMNPETLCRVKDSCLSYKPADCITQTDEDRAKIETITPWIYQIDGPRQYREEKTLMFWVKAAGYMVQVRIAVQNDPDTFRQYDITFDRQGNAHKRRNEIVNKSGHFNRVDRFWSSEDQPGRFVLFA